MNIYNSDATMNVLVNGKFLPPTQGGVYNSKCEMNSDCLKTKKEQSSRGINYDALSLSSSTLVETFLNLIEEKGDYKRGRRIP